MSVSKQSQRKPRRPEDERLPVGTSFAYGLQHVLTMYGGIIAVPLIIGKAAGLDDGGISVLIASCLFMGGLATILHRGVCRSSGRSCRWSRASRSPASPR